MEKACSYLTLPGSVESVRAGRLGRGGGGEGLSLSLSHSEQTRTHSSMHTCERHSTRDDSWRRSTRLGRMNPGSPTWLLGWVDRGELPCCPPRNGLREWQKSGPLCVYVT